MRESQMVPIWGEKWKYSLIVREPVVKGGYIAVNVQNREYVENSERDLSKSVCGGHCSFAAFVKMAAEKLAV